MPSDEAETTGISPEIQKLSFYACDSCPLKPGMSDCIEFRNRKTDLVFPCLVLMKNNRWNDFSYESHFEVFYLPDNEQVIKFQSVRIIQSGTESTNLPKKFASLPKDTYFTRGSFAFYNKVKTVENIKPNILSALNDIHFHRYTKDFICDIDEKLARGYTVSLFRDNFYDLEVSSDYAKISLETLENIRRALNAIEELDEDQRKTLRHLLFGSAITALESYLGDAFKYYVLNKDCYFYSFLKIYDFKNEKKINLSELGLQGDNITNFIKDSIKQTMNAIIFHRLKLVVQLYKNILNVGLPTSIMGFCDAVQKRHDIFHRNGKDITGTELSITPNDISRLLCDVKKFIRETELIITAQT